MRAWIIFLMCDLLVCLRDRVSLSGWARRGCQNVAEQLTRLTLINWSVVTLESSASVRVYSRSLIKCLTSCRAYLWCLVHTWMTHSLYRWDVLMMLSTHLDDPQPIQVRHTHDAEYTPLWPTTYIGETYSWCLLHTSMTHNLYRWDILMMLSTHLDNPQPVQVRDIFNQLT